MLYSHRVFYFFMELVRLDGIAAVPPLFRERIDVSVAVWVVG